MAKVEALDLTQLNGSVLRDILNTCAIIDARAPKSELGIKSHYKDVQTWAVPGLGYTSSNTTDDEFKEIVERSTSQKSFSGAYNAIYKLSLSKRTDEVEMKGAEKPPANAATPDAATRELQKEELERVKEAKAEADINAKEFTDAEIEARKEVAAQKQDVQDRINRTKALEEKLKGQKLYYENGETKETEEITDLRNQAESDPKQFIKDSTNKFKQNPLLKNLSPEEAQVTVEQAAITRYDLLTVNSNSPVFLASVAEKITSDPKLLNKFAPNPEDQEILKSIASSLTDQRTAQYELAKQFFDADKIPGVRNFQFSDTQGPNSQVLDVSNVASYHIGSLENQNLLLDNIKGFGEEEIKSQVLLAVGNGLKDYVGTLSAGNAFAAVYNSEFVQIVGLPALGLAESNVVAVEGSLLGKAIVGSGYGQIAGFIQTKTGINLGVKLATKKIGEKIAGQVVEKAAETVVGSVGGEAVGAAGGEAVGAAVGAAIPIPILNIITAAIGAVLGWVASKIPWQKIKAFFDDNAGVLMGFGALALIFGGLPLRIVGGGALLAGTAATIAGGGIILRGAVSGAGRFIRFITRSLLGIIATPVIVSVIVFPLLVALILFIINAGAYVVPPGGFGGSSGLPISGTPVNLNCDSLDKTLDPAAYAAELIACALDKSGLNPLFEKNASGLQNLSGVLNATAIDALTQSAAVYGSWAGVVTQHLQCVGYVAATAGQAYGQYFPQTDACLYISNPNKHPGYKYISGTNGMKGGDFFIINGSSGCDAPPDNSPGHIGVVISVSGVGVNCADANEVAAGKVRVANGCFVLSKITGYLRKN